MRAAARVKSLPSDLKKVYLLNHLFGQSIRKDTKRWCNLRPDIEIVGEDLHPIGQVRDFSPYIAKIKASGADAVVTGNWGADLSLLVKAAVEAGYAGKFFTYYAGVTGTPTALGTNGAGLSSPHGRRPHGRGVRQGRLTFKAKYNDDFYTGAIIRMLEAMSLAMAQSKSTDPVKVALRWKA